MHTADLFRGMTIEHRSPVALYFQLRQGIASLITAGDLKPGQRLPSVVEIAEICGVSKATAGRALEKLADEGILDPRRGSGVYVADATPTGIEVLVPPITGAHDETRLGVFLRHVADAVGAEFSKEARTFLTCMDPAHAVAREILGVARVRGARGLVAHEPEGQTLGALREVAQQLPTVSLFRPLPDADADCVTVDARPALTRLLRERIAAGQRSFAFLGLLVGASGWKFAHQPYVQLKATLDDVARSAGIRLISHLFASAGEMMAERDRVLRRVPPGSTIVMVPPGAVRPELRGPYDVITYTEMPESCTRLREQGVCVLYAGPEQWARLAARLLRERMQAGPQAPVRYESVLPVVHDSAKKGGDAIGAR